MIRRMTWRMSALLGGRSGLLERDPSVSAPDYIRVTMASRMPPAAGRCWPPTRSCARWPARCRRARSGPRAGGRPMRSGGARRRSPLVRLGAVCLRHRRHHRSRVVGADPRLHPQPGVPVAHRQPAGRDPRQRAAGGPGAISFRQIPSAPPPEHGGSRARRGHPGPDRIAGRRAIGRGQGDVGGRNDSDSGHRPAAPVDPRAAVR